MKFTQGILDEKTETSVQPSHSLSRLLLRSLFKVHFCHSGSLVPPRLDSYFRTSPQLFVAVVQSLQVLGLILDYAQDISGYADLGFCLWAFRLFRPELLVKEYTNQQAAFYLFLIFLLICAAVTMLELVWALLQLEANLPTSLCLLSRCLLALLHRILFLPVAFILLQYARDTAIQWEKALSVLGLAFTLILPMHRLAFVTDNNWYIRKFHLLAKSSPDFEVRELMGFMMIIILRQGTLSTSPVFNCGVTLLVGSYLYFQVIWTVPYFSILTSATKAVQYALAAWMSLAVFLGLLCDSAYVIFSLFVFCSPLISLFACCLLKWRLKQVPSWERSRTFPEFELSLRLALAKHSKGKVSDTALKDILLKGVQRFSSNKLVHLLFAQYYFYIREEPEYALLRLACAHNCEGSLVTDFQVFHFFEKISALSKSEERGYLDYVRYFRKTMRADFDLSMQSLEVLNLLHAPINNCKVLEVSMQKLAKLISDTNNAYYQVIQRFPLDLLMRIQRVTLRVSLFYDNSSPELLTKSNTRRGNALNANNIEAYTGTDVGVFVISCHKQKFGKIVFANPRCAQILDTTVEDIEGRDLDDFLPPPMAVGHNATMANFMRAGEAKEVFRSQLFLYAQSKYSVEVTFRFRPSAYLGIPYFVVAIRSKATRREFVLFDNNFTITSHSKYFHNLLGVRLSEKGTLNGTKLLDLLPGLDERQKRAGNRPFLYKHPDTTETYHGLFASTGLGSHVVHWVYIYKEESQVSDLVNSASATLTKVAELPITTSKIQEEWNDSESSSEASSARAQIQRYDGSNSSPTQVSNFAVSIQGFRLRNNVKFACKLYSLSFIAGAVLAALLALINIMLLLTTMKEMAAAHELSSTSMSIAPLYLAQITYFSRILSLITLEIDSKQLEAEVKSELQEVAANFQAFNMHATDMRLSDEIAVWTQYKWQARWEQDSLGSALSHFVTRFNSFIGNGKFEIDDDFMFLYRNGLGETFEAAKAKARTMLEETDRKAMVMILTAAGGCFLLTAVILTVSILLIVRSIMVINQTRSQLWKMLLRLTSEQLITLAEPHLERLRSVHGVAQLPTLSGFGHRKRGHTVSPSRKWPLLMVTFLLYALTTSSIFLLAGVFGYARISSFTTSSLKVVDRVNESVTAPFVSMFYLKEWVLDVTYGNGYFSLVPEGQGSYDVSTKILAEVEDLHSNICEFAADISQSALTQTVSNHRCEIANTECQRSALALGLHAAVHEFTLAMEETVDVLANEGTIPWSSLSQLETNADLLTYELLNTSKIASAIASKDVDDFETYICVYFALYCLGCTFLYLFFYRPRLLSLQHDCLNMWQVSLLIRSDYLHKS